MRKPRRGASYIMLSDGDLMALWTADPVAMAPLTRQAGTYARMTVEGITPRQWDSPRRPPRCTPFLLVGNSDGEEIWDGINQEQARVLFRWAWREMDKLRLAEPQPLKASDARISSLPLPEDRLRSSRP